MFFFFLLTFISWIVFRLQLSQKWPSLSVKLLIPTGCLTGISLRRHISMERAMLVYSETNISLHKKAVRGSSLTETEGFVLQDYPICIFLITAQAHRTTWFGMIKEAKRRNWGWLDRDSGFVNTLNYIWDEIQQSPNHNRKTVGFHIWLQRLWLKFLLAYKQKETWLLPVEGLNQNHLWSLLLWGYTATYIQNGVLVE